MRIKLKQTRQENRQELIHRYQELVHGRPFSMLEVSEWAISEGLWDPPRKSAVDLLARELSGAARVDYMSDPQGRRVRRMHARRVETEIHGEFVQQVFWDNMETAKPEHMHIAFQQRRGLIRSDCHQLKTDVDSYNENFNKGKPIQMSWDFTDDMDEMDQPTVYQPEMEEIEDEMVLA